jgi:predicted DNA-binding transcriptional regulator AlpA
MELFQNSVKSARHSRDAAASRLDCPDLTEFRNEPMMPQVWEGTLKGDQNMALLQMLEQPQQLDQLLTADDMAARLNVSKDWVWDHSSRKAPYLPVIRMGDGALRYRASKIEAFIDERERLTSLRRGRK